jgi:hypothetical protein
MISACGARTVEPVVMPVPTNTLAEMNTPVPANTLAEMNTPVPTNPPAEINTPVPPPTETLILESPTPVRMGFTVQNASFEVKVIAVEKPFRVYPGGDSFFTPGKGNMFLDLGIKVSNLTGSDTLVNWSDIYLANKHQERWYPTWGAYQETSAGIDSLTVNVREFEIDPTAHVFFGNNGYLRLIYRVPKDETYYYFGFLDLPLTEIDYK